MIKAGIISGAGYAAGELIRLLINHPDVSISWIQSDSHAGTRVADTHQGLEGELDMDFCEEGNLDNIDVLFLCTPHGESRAFLESHTIPEKLRIIDLSMDYRLPDGKHDFVYGVAELNRKAMVRGAKHVANPGCYANLIELSLLPLARNLLLDGDIHVTAISGSTASGAKLRDFTHYSWRNDNVSVYRALEHQHMPEIMEFIKGVQPTYNGEINFIPMRGSFSRGILAVIYMKSPARLKEIKEMYRAYYDDHSFTDVKDNPVDLKDVAGTNKCLIHLDQKGDKLVITAAIDNLLKGAAGNAVHAMNLLFGLQERVGLMLKATAY